MEQQILFNQNYSYFILKLNASNLLFGLHLLAKFITCKMRFWLHKGDTFQLCIPFPWPPHKYTQVPTNVFSISITDKKFFGVESSIAECEFSTIENNVVGSEKVTSSWDDRSETFFVYKKPFFNSRQNSYNFNPFWYIYSL